MYTGGLTDSDVSLIKFISWFACFSLTKLKIGFYEANEHCNFHSWFLNSTDTNVCNIE